MNEKRIDLTEKAPALIPARCDLWQAWWEDHDMWDGYAFYRAEDDADLEAAQKHATVDYVSDEYCWRLDDESEEEDPEESNMPDSEFTWEFEHNRWHLLQDGKATGVTLSRVRIWERSSRYTGDAGSSPGTV
jgi:hypothetical protein